MLSAFSPMLFRSRYSNTLPSHIKIPSHNGDTTFGVLAGKERRERRAARRQLKAILRRTEKIMKILVVDPTSPSITTKSASDAWPSVDTDVPTVLDHSRVFPKV